MMTFTRLVKNAIFGVSLCCVSAYGQDQMAYWNFNGQSLFLDNVLIAADVTGAGVSGIPSLKMSNQIINLNGADGTAYTDNEGVSHAGGKAPSWADIKGSGSDAEITLNINTLNWENLVLRFDYKSQLADTYDLAVSINEGDSWHKLANNFPLVADYDNWNEATIALSSLASVNEEEGNIVIENRESLWIRIDDLSFNGNDAFDFDNVELTGTVNENQLPIVEFASKNQLISENAGTATIGVTLVNPNASDVVVEFEIDPDTTADDIDDFNIPSYSVTFPAGSTTEQTVTINIVDDVDAESTEQLRLAISDIENGQIDSQLKHRIFIADNDTDVPQLFINEVMAKNVASYADENEEYDDWVEIYNPNLFEVDLADYIMKDGADTYTFPSGTEDTKISPSNFIIIWADEQSSQGPLHTNFKLSSAGEFVGLYEPDGVTEIDAVTYPEILDDISYGRQTDGADTWVTFEGNAVTPKASNGFNTDIDENSFENGLAYPNPVSEGVIYFINPVEFTLYNILGERVAVSNGLVETFNVSDLSKGFYILHSKTGYKQKIQIR